MGKIDTTSTIDLRAIERATKFDLSQVDDEPKGIDYKALRTDGKMKKLIAQLWREHVNSRPATKKQFEEALERDDLTPAEVMLAGVEEPATVNSTPEEMERYRKKLEYRSQMLFALLETTLAELEKMKNWLPKSENGISEE